MTRLLLILSILIAFVFSTGPLRAENNEDEYFYLPQERMLIDTRQHDKALEIFKNNLEKAITTNKHRDIAKYNKNIADIFLRKADYATAINYYKKAMEISKNINEKKLTRSSLHNTGVAFAYQGNYKEAEHYYAQALDISKELNFDYGILSAYNNLGNMYFNLAEYDKAQESLEKALEIANNTGVKEYQISVTLNLANIYNYKGHYDRAKQMYESVASISKDYQDQSLYTDALHNLAILEHNLGKYDRSIEYMNKLEPYYLKTGDKKKLSQLYLNLGASELKASSAKPVTEAIKLKNDSVIHLKKARDIAIEINAIDTGLMAHRQIQAYYQAVINSCDEINKAYSETMKYVRELEEFSNTEETKSIVTELKALEDPRQFCNEEVIARTIKEQIEINEAFIEVVKANNYKGLLPNAYMILADNYFMLGNYEKACEALEKAINLKKELYSTDIWRAYRNAARMYDKQGNKEKANDYYQKAVDSVLDITRYIPDEKDLTSYITEKQFLFREYADFKLKTGSIEGAMEILELGKLSEQADYLIKGINNNTINIKNPKAELVKSTIDAKTRAARINDAIHQEASANSQSQNSINIDDLRKQLQQARLDFQQKALQIQEKYPEILKYIAVKPTTMRTVKQLLPEGAILIQPVVFEDRTIIFLAPPGKVSTFKEIPAGNKDILNMLVKFRQSLNEHDEFQLKKAGYDLYKLLIAPIEKDIEGYDTLIISPYENLRYIPFQALHDGNKYMVEKFNIINLTGSGTLKLADQSGLNITRNTKFLAFGNPTEDLPSSEQEVKTIATNFVNNKIYIRSDALRNAFDEEIYNDYDIIHLATHGVLNNNNPGDSRLLFAGKDHNFLSVSEIMAYDFSNTMLIVLSACDSNIGITRGAEISALGAAFEMAAAPAVIASLWKVNDQSTSLLMEEFYHQLSQGNSRSKSLRSAQIKLINTNKYKNPYYWAPFVLMGNGK